jgi:DNA invertase Pin-like site-specific DNA recombinase
MTIAVGYVRVSTDEQAEHGTGLDIQRDAITALAAELGAELTEIYADEGISGKDDLDSRIGLADALAALAPGTLLLVYKLDRLARDLIVQEQMLAEAWRAGANVVPCSQAERIYCQPDDPNDPSRTLIRQILGAVAAYERSVIALRLRNGRRRKLRAVGYAGGPEPYGFTCEQEQATLADVTIARAAGFTWREIAVMLNGTHRPKRNGEPWTGAEIHRTWHRYQDRTSTNGVKQSALSL